MINVAAFYYFHALSAERLTELRVELRAFAESSGLLGLVLLAPEGINGTIAGEPETVVAAKDFLRSCPEFTQIEFKDSPASQQPFRRFKAEFRKEIVTFDGMMINPELEEANYLSAAQWHEVLAKRTGGPTDPVVIDTRNYYEWEVGKFKDAIQPPLDKFTDFAGWLDQQNISKEKEVLMYCTGGIRCEKASRFMQRLGYKSVYQLHGGILKYLEEFPHGTFDGECYVFDHRVAVKQDLCPSDTYEQCPHCGNPAERLITCSNCQTEKKICLRCEKVPRRLTCSKNCAHHAGLELAKGPPQR